MIPTKRSFAQLVSVTIRTADDRIITVQPNDIWWTAWQHERGDTEIEFEVELRPKQENTGLSGYWANRSNERGKVHDTVNGLPACGSMVNGEFYWTNTEPECKRCKALREANQRPTEKLVVQVRGVRAAKD